MDDVKYIAELTTTSGVTLALVDDRDVCCDWAYDVMQTNYGLDETVGSTPLEWIADWEKNGCENFELNMYDGTQLRICRFERED